MEVQLVPFGLQVDCYQNPSTNTCWHLFFTRVFGQKSGHGFLVWSDNDQHVSTLFSQLNSSHDFTRRKKNHQKRVPAQIWATRCVICNHTQLYSNGKFGNLKDWTATFFGSTNLPLSIHVPHVPGWLVMPHIQATPPEAPSLQDVKDLVEELRNDLTKVKQDWEKIIPAVDGSEIPPTNNKFGNI